jgi:hypothetical protein
MRACRSDLLSNDIILDLADHRRLVELSRCHLDYFQLMLGYDAVPTELIALAKQIRPPRATRSSLTNGPPLAHGRFENPRFEGPTPPG